MKKEGIEALDPEALKKIESNIKKLAAHIMPDYQLKLHTRYISNDEKRNNPPYSLHFGQCSDMLTNAAALHVSGIILGAGIAKHGKSFSKAPSIDTLYVSGEHGGYISAPALKFYTLKDMVLCLNAAAELVQGEKIDVPEQKIKGR